MALKTKRSGGFKSPAEENVVLEFVVNALQDLHSTMASDISCVMPIVWSKRQFLKDRYELIFRATNEGLPFLTRTLPKLGTWLIQTISGQNVPVPEGFATRPCLITGHPVSVTVIPRLLQVPIAFVLTKANDWENLTPFEKEQAGLLIKMILTILQGTKKLNVPHSEEAEAQAFATFVAIDESLPALEDSGVFAYSRALQFAQFVSDELLRNYLPDVTSPGRHGPGAVAGGEQDEEKWTELVHFDSVHQVYPYYDTFYPVISTCSDQGSLFLRGGPLDCRRLQLAMEAGTYRSMRRAPSPTARMLFVPKDSSGPRTICMEPKELMYLQQREARSLMSYLESHALTKGNLNFTDQSVNGALARSSSEDGNWATLDLSEASDRVSHALCTYLFSKEIMRYWNALRSHAVQYKEDTIPLKKYAPMGSAMCFPIESLCFFCICVGAILNCTKLSTAEACALVYVYGDDIIVPTRYYSAVVLALEDALLRVNSGKSFFSGGYRESCGIDAFRGENVTPYRLRQLEPRSPTDVQRLESYLDLASRCYHQMPYTAEGLISRVERVLGPIPRTKEPQSFFSVVTASVAWTLDDYRHFGFRPFKSTPHGYYRIKAWATCQKQRKTKLDSYLRFLSWIIHPAELDPSVVVVRRATQIRRRNQSIIGTPPCGAD